MTNSAAGIQRMSLDDFANTLPGVVYQFCVLKNGERKLLYISGGVKELFGCSPQEAYDDFNIIIAQIHPEERELHQKSICHATHKLLPWSVERRLKSVEGRDKWIEIKGVPKKLADGTVLWNAMILDISERKEMQAEIEILSTRDVLTGLPNRSFFSEQLRIALQHTKENPDHLFAVLIIGLDQFSVVNDSLGHNQGDILLRLVARRLISSVAAGDTVARFSDDKFLILLHEVENMQHAIYMAEQIRQSFEAPFILGPHRMFMTVTIGAVLSATDGKEAGDMLRNAHSALDRAKRNNRGGIEIFKAEMYNNALNTLKLHSELRNAIEHNQFFLHYLPIVSLKSGRIMGVEALIRWQHPQRGIVPPNEFIPAAEETSLISKIGTWVLEKACQDVQSWHKLGFRHIRLAVNFSAQQFITKDVIHLLEVMSAYNIIPQMLELEITERTAMLNTGQTRPILEELHDIGIGISIDDFGTGYSSLSYLKRLPCHVLKIDKSFVNDITDDQDAAIIAKTIIAMGHTLGLSVIAEGVERHEQLKLLKSFGCDEMQGFLFSRPVSSEQMVEMLQREKSI